MDESVRNWPLTQLTSQNGGIQEKCTEAEKLPRSWFCLLRAWCFVLVVVAAGVTAGGFIAFMLVLARARVKTKHGIEH